MYEPPAVDLSPLDAGDDPDRWQGVVDATMLRVDAVLIARARDPLTLIASWSRSLVVVATAILAVVVPAELALELREENSERVRTLVRLSTQTALGEQPPTGEELSRMLGHDLLP